VHVVVAWANLLLAIHCTVLETEIPPTTKKRLKKAGSSYSPPHAHTHTHTHTHMYTLLWSDTGGEKKKLFGDSKKEPIDIETLPEDLTNQKTKKVTNKSLIEGMKTGKYMGTDLVDLLMRQMVSYP
jgi:hypothetical protein